MAGWMREKQPRLLVIWGKYESSFDPSEPESYRKDVPNAEVHIVDGGHFALDTAADEIAALVEGFYGSLPRGEGSAGWLQRDQSIARYLGSIVLPFFLKSRQRVRTGKNPKDSEPAEE